jgi:hypothetical protein
MMLCANDQADRTTEADVNTIRGERGHKQKNNKKQQRNR